MNSSILIFEHGRKILFVLLAVCAVTTLHAQQQVEIIGYVFKTDRSGSMTERIPVYKDADKILKPKQEYLTVYSEDGIPHITVVIGEIEKYSKCILCVHSVQGDVKDRYEIKDKKFCTAIKSIPTGTYIVSLYADEHMLESKKFVVTTSTVK